MRLALVAAFLLLAFAGCVGSPASVLDGRQLDCTSNHQTVASTETDVLMPGTMPESMREAMGPRAKVSVAAREGQTLLAVATWTSAAGGVEVRFDGSGMDQSSTDQAWTSQGAVHAGNYTLELVGDPMAFEVVYTLYISASGCTYED
jgi:hypothetical protein